MLHGINKLNWTELRLSYNIDLRDVPTKVF